MTPDSTVYICSGVKLRSDQAHTIYFATETAQRNYFLTKVVRTYTDYTLTRNDVCYVEATLVDAEWWNYCMIEDRVNDQGMMRKFYFIESVEYIDEQTTGLHLKLDVMQTFLRQPNGGYAGNLPTCWVEREHSLYDGSRAFHVSGNTYTYNTVEEEIDTGDFISSYKDIPFTSSNWGIIVASTINLYALSSSSTASDVVKIRGSAINGFYSGLVYTITPLTLNANLMTLINHINTLGYIESIEDMYLYPYDWVTVANTPTTTNPCARITASNYLTKSYNFPSTIAGSYTPRNKKLLQYPYCFAYLTNNTGGAAKYQFERFSGYNNSTTFDLFMRNNPVSDASAMITPYGYYKGVNDNMEESVSINNFPRIPWSTDTYKLWLAQTANTRQYTYDQATFNHKYTEQSLYKDMAGNTMSLLFGGFATGLTLGVVDRVTPAATEYFNEALQSWANDKTYALAKQEMNATVKDRSIKPPTANGTAEGTMMYLSGSVFAKYEVKTVDLLHAKIIDDYFDHYGYQTNSFKEPNISSRPNWNFVKCNGFDAKLLIPQKYKIAISDVFNAGVTFWKNGDNIGNYSLNNLPT